MNRSGAKTMIKNTLALALVQISACLFYTSVYISNRLNIKIDQSGIKKEIRHNSLVCFDE